MYIFLNSFLYFHAFIQCIFSCIHSMYIFLNSFNLYFHAFIQCILLEIIQFKFSCIHSMYIFMHSFLSVEELKKLGMRQLDVSYEDFMAANCPSVTVCRNCCKVEEHCKCHPSKKDLGHVASDVGIALNNHRCGQPCDSVWALKKEDDDIDDTKKDQNPGTEDVGERLEKVLGDIKHKVGHASPNNINQRLIQALTDPSIKDELNSVMNSTDEEFLTKKLLEVSGKSDLSDLDMMTRDTIYREPPPPNKQPVPGRGCCKCFIKYNSNIKKKTTLNLFWNLFYLIILYGVLFRIVSRHF